MFAHIFVDKVSHSQAITMGHGNRNGLKRGETNSSCIRPRSVCLPALPLMAVDSSFTEREKGAGKEGGGKKEIRKVRGELWEKKREEEMTRLKDPLGKQRKGSERKRKRGMRRKKKKRAEEVRVALKRNEEKEKEAVFKSFLRLPKCSVGPTNLRRQPFNGLNNFYELEQDRSSWRMAIGCALGRVANVAVVRRRMEYAFVMQQQMRMMMVNQLPSPSNRCVLRVAQETANECAEMSLDLMQCSDSFSFFFFRLCRVRLPWPVHHGDGGAYVRAGPAHLF